MTAAVSPSPGLAAGKLSGKRVVVVGAGGDGNIGQAIARGFAAEGAQVVVAARSLAAIAPFAEQIKAQAALCDITDPHSVKRLFASVGASVDIAINSAGRSLFRPFMETTGEDIAELAALHVTGPLLFTQQAVLAMPNGGSIIHISSLTARMVMADHVAYMATKAASEVVIRAAALEFGRLGIRVNGIAPSLTETPMTQAFFANPSIVAQIREAGPLRRLGTVADVADAALWLAGDRCFVTGEILQVNGGMAVHSLS